jgi:superfamily II DNA or RNA helicase
VKLRPYQLEAEKSAMQAWADGNTSCLGVMPTGTGKTVVFASIIRSRLPARALVIAHRSELIFQARDKIQKVTGLTVDIEMGEYKSRMDKDMFSPKAQVVVSTIQTQASGGDGGGRMGKFDPKDFGLLIIDEAHHAASASYRKVIDYYKTNPKLVVLGVTATPDRSDEEALGQIFDTVAFDYEILDAIKDGWLVPIEQQMVSIEEFSFENVRTTAGDLNGADLAAVMTAEKPLQGVASATIDIIGSKRGIGFASSVAHAEMLCEIFNRHKSGMCGVVSAKTDAEERKKIIADFAQGKIQWLWNCGIFTEGFDDSGVEVISMARPTKSRALYAQMAGRATRPHESIAHRLNDVLNSPLRRATIARSCKPSCLIIDFVGNSGKHKLMTTADILGGNVSDEILEAAVLTARKAGKPMRMDKVIEEEEQRIAEMKAKRLAEEARKARLVGKSTYKTTAVDPFDLLKIKPITKERDWDKGKSLSEKQRGILREKMGLNPDDYPYRQGKQLIDAQFKIWNEAREKGFFPCTMKMCKVLKKHGIDAVGMPIETGKQYIDAIAKNGWHLPEGFVPQAAPAKAQETKTKIEDDDVPF